MMEPNEEFYLGVGYFAAAIITLICWAIVVWGFDTEVNPGIVGGTMGVGVYRMVRGVMRQRNA